MFNKALDYNFIKALSLLDLDIEDIVLNIPCASHNINDAAGKLPSDFEDGLLYEIALHHQLDYSAKKKPAFAPQNEGQHQTFLYETELQVVGDSIYLPE